MTDFVLDDFIPYRLARAADALSRDFSAVYRDRFGLSVVEWRILVHVNEARTASVRDIEARVGMEKSKVSRAAVRLERRSLLTKAPSTQDRRLIVLSLSKQGQAMMSELLPLAQAYQDRLAQSLGEELVDLNKALTQLTQLHVATKASNEDSGAVGKERP